MDALARELNMDPVELRRKNFVKEFPHTMASGLTIDSGDYEACLDRLLEHLDLDAIRAEQAGRRESGDAKQVGVGFSTYNEMCGLAPSRILGAIRYAVGGWDSATVRFQPLGSVQVVVGTSPHGQSHETTFAQIVADELGVGVDDVEVLHGDTAVSQQGMDTYGSRSLTVGGIALYHASQKIIAKARAIVAHQLEVSEGGSRVRGGDLHGEGVTRSYDGIQAVAFAAHAGAQISRTDGARPRGDRGLRSSELLVAGAVLMRLLSRSTPETGDTRPHALCRGRRRRQPGQPAGSSTGRCTAGITQGSRRRRSSRKALRRGGQPAHDDDDDLPRPVGRGAPVVRDRPHRDAGGQPARREGRGGDRHDRGRSRSDQRVVDALSHLGVTDVGLPATPERVWKAIEEVRS
jgi:carbon-monoxide dehydrogenase large subunit